MSWSSIFNVLQLFSHTAARTVEILAISIPAYAVIAVCIWWFSDVRRADTSFKSVSDFVFPGRTYRHRSARVDFLHAALSIGLWGELLSLLFTIWAGISVGGLMVQLFGERIPPDITPTWIAVCQFLALVITRDFGFYIGHFLTHRVPLFWRVHRPHHSAEVMTVFTSYRLHPLDRAFTRIFHTVIGAMGVGTTLYLTGSKLLPTTLALIAAWGTMVSIKTLFDHGNYWISFGPLSYIFSSPAMHQIHHSAEVRHWDQNLGEVFSIWDWIFGTIYIPTKREYFARGIRVDELGDANPHLGLWQFYVEPLMSMAAMLRRPQLAHFRVETSPSVEAKRIFASSAKDKEKDCVQDDSSLLLRADELRAR